MGRCYNTIVVDAPVDKVWETVRNFHDLSWAEGVVTKLDVVGEKKSDEIGAKRVLNEVFHETLQTIDDDERMLTYSIDDGPGPCGKDVVKSYIGQVHVLPVTADDTSFVEWQSNYETDDDEAVGEMCNPIYHALLGTLKKHFA